MSRAPAIKRMGEEWIHPLPEYADKIPPLPPVHTIAPDQYIGPTGASTNGR